MIAYFDTSALVKLYVSEAHRPGVLELRDASEVLATSIVSYVELRSAFARRIREDGSIAESLLLDRQAFQDDWAHWLVLSVDQPLVALAGRYTETFSLRAYDSLHLAAAQTLRQRSGLEVAFACFDRRLNDAADLLGLAAPFLKV